MNADERLDERDRRMHEHAYRHAVDGGEPRPELEHLERVVCHCLEVLVGVCFGAALVAIVSAQLAWGITFAGAAVACYELSGMLER